MRWENSTTAASTDPFVTRQHAEVAAVEAYQRGQPNHDRRIMQPDVQRRRSQKTNRTEGSHFDDARFGRRQSQKNDGSKSKPSRLSIHTRSSEERVITHRASLLPIKIGSDDASQGSSPLPPGRVLRKRASEYTDGSPEPRHAQHIQRRNSNIGLERTPDRSKSCVDPSGVNQLATRKGVTPQIVEPSTGRSVEKYQADAEAIAEARDKFLVEFQRRKVRERKSFLFAPFQRRRTTGLAKTHAGDGSLPPFNYADDTDLSPVLVSSPPPPISGLLASQHQTRKLSGSLKGRLRRVFRRASKPVAIEMPPQHVEAKDFRWTVKDCDMTQDTIAYDDFTDPFMTIASEQPHVPNGPSASIATGSNANTCHVSSAKSRITSWTNSSIGNASTIRTRADPLIVQEEGVGRSSVGPPLVIGKRSSTATLRIRKVSSFFGRTQNRLHKVSDANPRSSMESRGLYNALQKRINPTESTPFDPAEASEQSGAAQATRYASCMTPDSPVRPQHMDGVLSPTSIYSRATDGKLHHLESSEDVGVITVTGREVKRYSIWHSKSTHAAKPSADWRRWLSNEFGHFGLGFRASSGGGHSEHSPSAAKEETRNIDVIEDSEVVQSADNRLSSRSSGTTYRLPRPPARPRTVSKTSSYMNERYPMVSSHEHGSRNTSSSRSQSRQNSDTAIGRQPSSVEKTSSVPSMNSKQDVGGLFSATPVAKSTSALDILSNVTNRGDELDGGTGTTNTDVSQFHERSGNARRPKSAHELRVKYKNGANGTFRPLEIRRKRTQTFGVAHNEPGSGTTSPYVTTSDLPQRLNTITSVTSTVPNTSLSPDSDPLRFRLEEDPTLVNISAGPYARVVADGQIETVPQQQHRAICASQHALSAQINHDRATPPSRPMSHKQQENQRPLDNLPSSEWLETGGKNILHETRPASRQVTERSPGHRLVTDWLGEREARRRRKASPPTFL